MCKHLIHCVSPIPSSGLQDFFRRVQRERNWSFLRHHQLVALPEFRQNNDEGSDIGLRENSLDTEFKVGNGVDSDGLVDEAFLDDGSSDYTDQDSSDDEVEDAMDPEDFFASMVSAVDIAREQHRKGNKAFVDKFMASLTISTLVKEFNRKRDKLMSQTWEKDIHPATKYFK